MECWESERGEVSEWVGDALAGAVGLVFFETACAQEEAVEVGGEENLVWVD